MIKKLNAVLKGTMYGMIAWPIATLAYMGTLIIYSENDDSIENPVISILFIPFILPFTTYFCIKEELEKI